MNRWLWILAGIVLMATGRLSAQTIDAPWLTNKKMEVTPKTIFDTSRLRVYYQLTYRPDREVKERMEQVLTVLLVGEKALMYEDYNRLRKDSLAMAYANEGKTMGEYMEAALRLKPKSNDVVYTLLEEGKLIYALNAIAFSNYYYEEPIPSFDWQLTEESKVISGLNCKKAKTTFRGRNYEAWYCSEVALPYGPYKFGGLPGLIVELSDEERDYQFLLVNMQQGDWGDQIAMDFENNRLMKVTREGAMKALENYRRNPTKVISQKVKDSDGKPQKVKPQPHNPIELK